MKIVNVTTPYCADSAENKMKLTRITPSAYVDLERIETLWLELYEGANGNEILIRANGQAILGSYDTFEEAQAELEDIAALVNGGK